MTRSTRAFVGLGTAVLVLVVAIWLGGPGREPRAVPSSSPPPNAVLTTVVQDFGFTGAFDPVGEYLSTAWGLYSELLLRTLVTYRHVAGPEGTIPMPDLATDTGRVSPDGLVWTFTLKPGIRWGPPLDRPIISADVEFAFRRIETASLVAQYGFYYDGTIVGMDGPLKAMPDDIEGIETPDERTVVFHLVRPTGDFQHRLALPASAPVPGEVAGCFRRAGLYGQYVISSGPFMIRADKLEASSCRTLRPLEGYEPEDHLILVRNPNYDPATDSSLIRTTPLSEIDLRVEPDPSAILRGLSNRRVDALLPQWFDEDMLRRFIGHPRVRIHDHAVAGLRYLAMNLLLPPFDDLHVRRAVSLMVDREATTSALGPAVPGTPATGLLDPAIFGSEPASAETPGNSAAGNRSAARLEMAASRYDADGDGLCDRPACDVTLFLSRPGFEQAGLSLQRDLAAIGIRVDVRERGNELYGPLRVTDVALSIGNWVADYPDPEAFAPLLGSRGIECEASTNLSNLGLTEGLARRCGVLNEWRQASPIPSVDDSLRVCESLAGSVRRSCWNELDRRLTQDIVPWVPLAWPSVRTITGDTVTGYQFDQFGGMLSLCHLALR